MDVVARRFSSPDVGGRVDTRIADAATLRSRMFIHLLAPVCSPPFGYFSHEGFLTLDTGTRCSPLPVDPEVDAVEGQNIFSDAFAAYERAASRCAQGEPVELSRGPHPDPWRIECKSPMPTPYAFHVGNAPVPASPP